MKRKLMLLLKFLIVIGSCIALIKIGVILYRNIFLSTIFYANVVEVQGNVLKLDNGKVVQVAGVYIPQKDEENYRADLDDNIKQSLKDKQFKFRIILQKNIRYPEYDLVNAYSSDGSCINKKLIEEGMAFFDQGYYPGKKVYEKLERIAKGKKVGIWKEKDNLKLMFISRESWWSFHYPECPEVDKIKSKDKIEYYFLPKPIFFYRSPDTDCKWCKEIEIKYNRPKLFTYSDEDWKKDYQKQIEREKKLHLNNQ